MSEEKYVPQGTICNYLTNQNTIKCLMRYQNQPGYKRPSDGCWTMANNFYLMNDKKFTDIPDDQKSFYQALKFWQGDSFIVYGLVSEITGIANGQQKLISYWPELECLNFLNNTGLDIFHPDLDSLQKWHLFVSVFACSLICKHYSKSGQTDPIKNTFNFSDPNHFWKVPLKRTYRLPELQLWIIENSEMHYLNQNQVENSKSTMISSITEIINKYSLQDKVDVPASKENTVKSMSVVDACIDVFYRELIFGDDMTAARDMIIKQYPDLFSNLVSRRHIKRIQADMLKSY